jgi:hypothetical protein
VENGVRSEANGSSVSAGYFVRAWEWGKKDWREKAIEMRKDCARKLRRRCAEYAWSVHGLCAGRIVRLTLFKRGA